MRNKNSFTARNEVNLTRPNQWIAEFTAESEWGPEFTSANQSGPKYTCEYLDNEIVLTFCIDQNWSYIDRHWFPDLVGLDHFNYLKRLLTSNSVAHTITSVSRPCSHNPDEEAKDITITIAGRSNITPNIIEGLSNILDILFILQSEKNKLEKPYLEKADIAFELLPKNKKGYCEREFCNKQAMHAMPKGDRNFCTFISEFVKSIIELYSLEMGIYPSLVSKLLEKQIEQLSAKIAIKDDQPANSTSGVAFFQPAEGVEQKQKLPSCSADDEFDLCGQLEGVNLTAAPAASSN